MGNTGVSGIIIFAMHILFLKIALILLACIVAGTFLKIALHYLGPVFAKKKHMKYFRQIIDDGIYDYQTIVRALTCYIPAGFLDTSSHQKIDKTDTSAGKRKNLTRAIDLLLDRNTGPRYLLLLSSSGGGKTSFILNYFLHNQMKPESRQHQLCIVPLSLKNAAQVIQNASDQNNTILFLDALDEDVHAFHSPDKRLAQLIEMAGAYKRIIITCHKNFIPKKKHTPSKQGFTIIQAVGKSEPYFFELKEFYLSLPTLTGIKKIIHWDLPALKAGLGKKITTHVKKHSHIGFTPLTLKFLTSVYPGTLPLDSINNLYQAIFDRSTDNEGRWKDKPMLREFLEHLAVDIYTGRFSRNEERLLPAETEEIARTMGINLKRFSNDLKSFMTQDQSGSLFFSHRSFMEFLFIRQLMSGNENCFNTALSDTMKTFLFETLQNRSELDMSVEFQWLSRFKLRACGTSKNSMATDGQAPVSNLFRHILVNNKPYRFLARLKKLIENPIFYEFGWDPQLNIHLKQAIFQNKTSLLKLPKRKWRVLIDPTKIEITMPGQHKVNILINQKDFDEYSGLEEDKALTALNRSINMAGLKIVNTVNQSGAFALLPDLNNFKEFTLYFWLDK